jgi:hypothetical protein
MKLTTNPHLVLTQRISGAIPLLPYKYYGYRIENFRKFRSGIDVKKSSEKSSIWNTEEE